jgi:hypothetical protein
LRKFSDLPAVAEERRILVVRKVAEERSRRRWKWRRVAG